MAKTKQKKATKTKQTKSHKFSLTGSKGGRAIMAGAAGAVVGAAIGAGTAYVMNNDKAKKTIGKAVDGVTTFAADSLEAADGIAYDTHHKAARKTHKVSKPAKAQTNGTSAQAKAN